MAYETLQNSMIARTIADLWGDLSDLVHEVLIEQVANYLGLDPDTIDGSPELD